MTASAPKEILELVARFEQQLEAYKSGQYNETQVRREFLDPFFKALGWDIDNKQGYAETYKDVIHEDQIRIAGATKAPDYCFRIGGTRKYFLEAKKPSVFIKEDISPAYQLRRYAWSAKLPLSILSDFEELAVYDCRVKPHKDDAASTARIFYCTFRDYAEKWDWIYERFSRDAVLKGSFDKFADSTKGKKGTAEVDAAFLAEIENWRTELARNLALRNPRLTQRELNFAIQRIIDRIIFLRICEDRGLEDYGRLRALVNGDRIYPRLCQLFEAADDRYNSGLFHFKPEKDRHEAPDELTLALELDDQLLRDILRGLYYPDSPYEFSVFSADILGQVYEQFLGKVIRLTEGHRAVVDDKPEVKKAGGVYYTPTYIVDYIVRQTVGKLLEEIAGEPGSAGASSFGVPALASSASASSSGPKSSPAQPAKAGTPNLSPRATARVLDRVAQFRILDPACGSGSFLIGAYQFLLDWHLQFYTAHDPEKWARARKAALVQTTRGWRLTIAERKRILLNNIFGVDIDTQAVEVTKLSLLLKVLEGETGQTLQTIFRLFHERALPDLGDNIKCGNSLIGPDFYQQQQRVLLDDEERYRVNVFDWQAEFPHVFRRRISTGELRETAAASPLDYTMPGVPLHGSYSYRKKKGAKAAPPPVPLEPGWEGGFDAVIGNPPYVRMEEFKELKSYLRRNYDCHEERSDLYAYFIERGHWLLRENGRFGMIVSNKFLRANYGAPLRETLRKQATIDRVADFAGLPVFVGATVRTVVLLTRRASGQKTPVIYSPPPCQEDFLALVGGSKTVGEMAAANSYEVPVGSLAKQVWSFGEANREQLIERLRATTTPLVRYCPGRICMGVKSGCTDAFIIGAATRRAILKCDQGASGIIKPVLNGRDIRRYQINWPESFLIYTYHGVDVSSFSAVLEHLKPYKPRLQSRATSQEWYELQQPQLKFSDFMAAPKIVFPDIATTPRFALDDKGYFGTNTIYFIAKPDLYLLGLLNSRLGAFYFATVCAGLEGKNETYLRFFGQYLEGFPVRVADLSTTSDRTLHNRMVSLVEQMLGLHKQLAAARTPQEQTALERQIAATDTHIDRLVYDLYGLTEDEISIVEGAGGEQASSRGKE